MKIIQENKKVQGLNFDCKRHSFLNLFAKQVRENPKAVATVFCGESLSFEELDFRSSTLAKLLKIRGVKPGKVVALGLYNCLDFMVGMLAIFKSGGVYLPIDPHYPNQRIKRMLEDAGPWCIITEKSLKKRFLKWNNNLFLIDNLPDLELEMDLSPVDLNQTAYIVYTSGTTGNPKGISVSHSSLAYAVLAYRDLHPARYNALMTGSISFDPSLLIVVYTLASGGMVCLPENNDGIDPKQPDEYIQLIKTYSLSYLLCTPSLYSNMLKKSTRLISLECVDLCGENIPNNLPKKHSIVLPNSFLYNVYGPSEYAMGITAAEIYNPNNKTPNDVTIGTPFFENAVYILNEHFQPLPVGIKGEIFIGGQGLSDGYLHNDKLTKEKFLWITLPDNNIVRLYRTGDMGCYLPDGNIKFLGREDRQVKVLGHRIELEEVEHIICGYSEVSEAVVVFCNFEDRENELIAYYSSNSNIDITKNLKIFLKAKFPKYMLPSKFIKINKWPYNENGKINRKELKT